MAVTIAELISKREQVRSSKKQLYDIETSVGKMTFKIPDAALAAESWEMESSADGNKNIVYQCCVDPDLKDKELREAYGVAEPFDVVTAILQAGEINMIASFLLKKAGFGGKIIGTLHKQAKN